MKRNLHTSIITAAIALFLMATSSANAVVTSQLGVLDVNANGGINPTTGVAWEAGDTYRLIFITSDTFQATSTDINDYNAFVQGVAAGSSKGLTEGGATWKVVGSTDFVDARTNTGTNLGPVGESTFLMDSTIFATGNTDLWNGSPAGVAPNLDEEGNFLIESRVFTGTNGGLNTNFRQLGDPNGVTETGVNDARNAGAWLINFNNSQTNFNSFYALSDPLTIQAGGVPEPATATLAMLGLGGLVMRRRRSLVA